MSWHYLQEGGGSILAAELLGWRTVAAVELDAGARQIIFDRQRDGIIKPFPIWDDVTTFDGKPWAGNGWVPAVAARAVRMLGRLNA